MMRREMWNDKNSKTRKGCMKIMKKHLLIFIFLFSVHTLNADDFSRIAGSIVLETLNELEPSFGEISHTQFFNPAILGRIYGIYTWCRNTSQAISDRSSDRSVIIFWLRQVEACTRMREHINEVFTNERNRILNSHGFRNAQEFQEIYLQNAREIGDILMSRLSVELGVPLP
jgi:hypothetical protein